jgi:putative ABC transport system permease protein
VLVGADLLTRLGRSVGDRLVIGATTVTVRGVVTREPDRPASLVALGPRVFLSGATLARTGLLRPESRVRYRALVRLPENEPPRPVRDRISAAATDPAVRAVTFDDAQPGMRRFFAQVTTYLGLVGLVSLLVGGIGVASSIRTFLERRLATIAILKSIGATSRSIVATYLLQSLVLGVAGSVLGALVGVVAQPVLARLLQGVIALDIGSRAEPFTLLRAVSMGVASTLLVSLWPLLKIRDVGPSLILRARIEARLPGARRPWLVAIPIGAGLVALALWQAGSLKIGGIFLGGAVVALLALAALARGVSRLASAMPRSSDLAWRHGIANLRRPGGQSGVVVVTLGVGVMLLVSVALLERSLVQQIDVEQRRQAPSLFFIDVQTDQRATLAATVERAAGVTPALTPVVRARLSAIDGKPVTREMVERRRRREDDRVWYVTRDYLLTFADAAPAANVVTRGRWWTPAEAAAGARASVEVEAARALGVDVGGRLTFDVQGVPVEATVENLRKVDWQSLTTNFFVILSRGALEGAPTTWVGTARVPPSAEAAVQDGVVQKLPNVTAIPVRDVLERLSGVLDRLALAIRAIAAFSIGSGLAVMLGTLTASRYQRLYESVVLRTVGATRATVARAFAVEFGCLGIAAGIGGTALAGILAWVVLRFVLMVPWRFDPAAMGFGVAATTLVAIAVGFLATFRLLGQKPLAVLRHE